MPFSNSAWTRTLFPYLNLFVRTSFRISTSSGLPPPPSPDYVGMLECFLLFFSKNTLVYLRKSPDDFVYLRKSPDDFIHLRMATPLAHPGLAAAPPLYLPHQQKLQAELSVP